MLKARVQTELWLEFFFLRPGQGLNPKVHFFSNGGRTKNDVNHPMWSRGADRIFGPEKAIIKVLNKEVKSDGEAI